MIRLAEPEDAPAMAAIYASVVEETAISFELEPPPPEEIELRRNRTVPEYPWLVDELEGRVVGYAYGHQFNERAAYLWTVETSVYVDAAARGQGSGRRLYAALIPLLRAQGYREAIAGIRVPNEASVALHESFGFERVATYTRVGWKLGEWHDVGIWQLSLDASASPPAPPARVDQLAADEVERILGGG